MPTPTMLPHQQQFHQLQLGCGGLAPRGLKPAKLNCIRSSFHNACSRRAARPSVLTKVLVPGRSNGSDSRDNDHKLYAALFDTTLTEEETRARQKQLETLWNLETEHHASNLEALPHDDTMREPGTTDLLAVPSTSGSDGSTPAPGNHSSSSSVVAHANGYSAPLTLPHLDGDVARVAAPLHTSIHAANSSSEASDSNNGAALPPSTPSQGSGSEQEGAASPSATAIPGTVVVISCVSASLTLASCVFNTALPIYMVSELKMSMASMGLFEGVLEAFSYVVRMFSGVVSDMMTSRKAAITLGFAMGAAAKFGMASASSVFQLFASKAIDRLANGVQAAPRDALIGDLSPAGARSACFGLAQSLRKWGSMVGALLCFFLMKASNNNYKLIFYAAAGVSLASCLAFVLLVPAHARPQHARPEAAAAASSNSSSSSSSSSSETQPLLERQSSLSSAVSTSQQQQQQQPEQQQPAKKAGFSFTQLMKDVGSMGAEYYRMLSVICLYALGHINESLLEARAIEVGFGKAESTLIIAALCCVTFLVAYPLGRLDDKCGARVTFGVGMSALIAGHLTMLLSGTFPMAVFGACVFLGVHWAVIQGPLLSIMVGLAPAHLRGTAFGIFYTAMAFTALIGGRVYGTVWHAAGANAAFGLSAALITAALVALPWLLPGQKKQQQQPAVVAAPA